MLVVHIFLAIVFLLMLWIGFGVYKFRQYCLDDQDFWVDYTSMYDCSDFERGEGSVLYLPGIKGIKATNSRWMRLPNGEMLDLKKYMNWLRCLDVTRASCLIGLLDDQWYTFYVKWDNCLAESMLLNTVISALTVKPEFLATRPCNIWCRFNGGPPGKDCIVESSLLNFIVDRVLLAILKDGVTTVDTKVVEALNSKEVLLLEGPK